MPRRGAKLANNPRGPKYRRTGVDRNLHTVYGHAHVERARRRAARKAAAAPPPCRYHGAGHMKLVPAAEPFRGVFRPGQHRSTVRRGCRKPGADRQIWRCTAIGCFFVAPLAGESQEES